MSTLITISCVIISMSIVFGPSFMLVIAGLSMWIIEILLHCMHVFYCNLLADKYVIYCNNGLSVNMITNFYNDNNAITMKYTKR